VTTPLVDTHCHLCLPAFADDLPAVLARAASAGVERILVPGIDLPTSRRAVDLAEAHRAIFAAVGLHPHGASDWSPASYQELRNLARSPRVVAIGETGLDYYRDYAPRLRQVEAFEAQLELAGELGLPVVVHNRNATDDVLDRLTTWAERSQGRSPSPPGVLHAFSGDQGAASRALQAGFYIGVAGPLTYTSAGELRRLTAALPLDRLLLETDAPYLPPTPHRGQRNEPAYVAIVSEALADARRVPADGLRRACWDNAATLFRWTYGIDDGHIL
jgi:TatD DNase family protein